MKRLLSSILVVYFTVTFITYTFGKEDMPIVGNLKAEAAVFNAAIGDALGRATEFIDTTNKIYQKFGPQGVVRLSQVKIVHPVTKKIIAPYTDDTVMSLIVLETMLEGVQQNFPVHTMLDRLARLFAQLFGKEKYNIDPLYDLRAHGLRNSKAGMELNYLIQGNKDCLEGWWLNRPEKDIVAEAGCGSVMRAWPIGLVFADNIPLVIELANEQSKITHRHPMARAASVAMAVGTAYAYKDKSVEEVVQAMIFAAEQFDAEELLYKTKAKKISLTSELTADLISRDALLTSDMIRYAYNAARSGKLPQDVLGSHNQKQQNYRSPKGFLLGWSADEALAAAVYLFVRYSDNPQQAIIEGVNTPGDSDSIASLAGALIGAKTGTIFHDLDTIQLENRNHLIMLCSLIP
jgi:ADP-ribosylglycohydrolase